MAEPKRKRRVVGARGSCRLLRIGWSHTLAPQRQSVGLRERGIDSEARPKVGAIRAVERRAAFGRIKESRMGLRRRIEYDLNATIFFRAEDVVGVCRLA